MSSVPDHYSSLSSRALSYLCQPSYWYDHMILQAPIIMRSKSRRAAHSYEFAYFYKIAQQIISISHQETLTGQWAVQSNQVAKINSIWNKAIDILVVHVQVEGFVRLVIFPFKIRTRFPRFSQLGVSISHQNDGQDVLHVGIMFTSVNDDSGVGLLL